MKLFLPFAIFISTIFVTGASCHGATDKDFDVSITPVDAKTSLDKPILVKVTVVYKSKKALKLYMLEGRFLVPPGRDLTFLPPAGWKPRGRPIVVQSPGIVFNAQKVVQNQVMSATINLKAHFHSLLSGKVTLPTTLHVWPEENGGYAKKPITLKTELKLEIQEPSQQK